MRHMPRETSDATGSHAGSADGFLPMNVLARRYHIHWPGVIFVLTTVLIALGAIQTQNNVLYIGFGLAVGALLFSGVVSGSMLMGVRVEREVEHAATVGGVARLRYRVRNSNRLFPAFALIIEEQDTVRRQPRPSWRSHLSDSLVGASVANLPAGGTQIVEATSTATRRGVSTFGLVRVWTTFPFGIARKSVLFVHRGEPQQMLIRPAIRALDRRLVRRLVAAGTSRVAASRAVPGGREEFLGVRPFATGDAQSMVAWRLSARSLAATDQLLVRESASLSGQRVCVQVDARVPDLDRSLDLAASLVAALVAAGSSVELTLGGASYTAVRSIRQMGPMLDAMARWDGEARTGNFLDPRTGTVLRIGAPGPDRLSAADIERLAIQNHEGAS